MPEKRTGSCATKVMRSLRDLVETVERSTLSINILPLSGRTTASSAIARVDFPEPVRPMIAVVEPPGMWRDIFVREGSRVGA